MTYPIFAHVTLHIEVLDAQAMWRRAYGAYEENNGTADQGGFEDICGTEHEPDICECARMVFDPGDSPPGIQIHDSLVEIRPPSWDDRYPHFIGDRGDLGTDGFGGGHD
ncbi:hypothetical protein PX699_16700 [Sphingobium sp. H39-3-25]|uniref:hypothetical protein n=1 Tax=Sphingomonadales TaxID=204457 RepID=UPI00082ECC68|nr:MULTISPECIES: hypothetical protein [Sphingomonadaceae]MDF0491572.1 hypothetical protein [Sphingomonas pollutisoli]MDF0543993.1 hypothetical protein [Sphingobium arseniciresistens]